MCFVLTLSSYASIAQNANSLPDVVLQRPS